MGPSSKAIDDDVGSGYKGLGVLLWGDPYYVPFFAILTNDGKKREEQDNHRRLSW